MQRADSEDGVHTPLTPSPALDNLKLVGREAILSTAEAVPGTTGVERTTDMFEPMASAPVPAKSTAFAECSEHCMVEPSAHRDDGAMSDLVMRGAVRCGIEDSSCSSRAARVAAAMAQVLDAPLALAVIIPAPMQSSEAAA